MYISSKANLAYFDLDSSKLSTYCNFVFQICGGVRFYFFCPLKLMDSN